MGLPRRPILEFQAQGGAIDTRAAPVRVRTAKTDPIRVDWLPVGGRGAVGLTFAPGKRSPSRGWERNLGDDLDRLVRE